MGSKVWIWKSIPGIPGRFNDVLYARPKSLPTPNLLVFFGGDVQDTRENMEKHRDSKEYVKWNLENTATLLSEQFPCSHVFVIRPVRMSVTRNAVFSCFDNFVSGDKYGTPSFCPVHKTLKHLRELLLCCLEHVKTLRMSEDVDDYNLEMTNLSLMGFSKGCAVLNQILHEFHYYQEHPNSDTDINRFVKLIKDMWWLDAGHNGQKDTWITEQNLLRSFAKLKINTHIHVTPYQVRDTHRPWIREEEHCFDESLQSMGVPVQRTLHFGDKAPSLSSHFHVLTCIGSDGTLKGLLPQQLEQLDCQIILGNTYHLGNRPGTDILRKAGGLHKFMNWKRALLTDSGGFQMVSLLQLAEITEEGVKFKSPYNESECMLTPEHSIQIQNAIGADIIMQLDDVVKSTITGPRVEEAMHRTTRWLDRCLSAHERPNEQSIFPIVQGGLDPKLRSECARQLIQREVNGYAVGGLSGGESKDDFWRMVHLSTDILPKNKPRYLMGVGFAVDLVVCCALGIDMYDCVFPTRTARFGCALTRTGQLNLRKAQYSRDLRPIDEACECSTCKTHTRAYLHQIATTETVSCHLLTVHNIAFQMRLMRDIRESIKEQRFPKFIQEHMLTVYPTKDYPTWIINALEAVNVTLL